MARLDLRFLGGFQATLNGAPVAGFESNKVRALLTFLAVEAGWSHSRTKLGGLLWPDQPETAALSNLRYALSNLRQALGDRTAQPPFLIITRSSVQFNTDSDYWLDVNAFNGEIAAIGDPSDVSGLEQAAALYRGSFLENFNLPGGNAFEEWVSARREEFQQQILKILGHLSNYCEMIGEVEKAQAWSRRQLGIDPWLEEAHRQLMRLLAVNGQRSESLKQYQICKRSLAQELGVEPSEETTALYNLIRGQQELPLRTTSRPGTQKGTGIACLGRETELGKLDGWLQQALARHGRAAFIIGEPGSGKTILALEFLKRAVRSRSQLIVAAGGCNAYTGRGDPFLPFREILGALVGDLARDRSGAAALSEGSGRLPAYMPWVLDALLKHGQDLIDRFIPAETLLEQAGYKAPLQSKKLQELLERRKNNPAASNLNPEELLEQYTRFLISLSQRYPLVIVVDDLQWVDQGSASLFLHIGRRLQDSRIFLIGVCRSGDIAPSQDRASHTLEMVIRELQRDSGDIQIDLDQANGDKFVEALLNQEPNNLPESFRDTLYQHTAGHPLFTVELLRGFQERGDLVKDDHGVWILGKEINWEKLPPRVEAVIAEYIQQLPSEWRSLLSIASVEGEIFSSETAGRILDVPEETVFMWLSGPLSKKHQLVVAKGVEAVGSQRLSQYRFRHFLFQKYLYTQLDPVERARLHHAVGTTLEELCGESSRLLAVQLVRHFELAGENQKAVQYLISAGNQAVKLFANPEAIHQFQHGLELLKKIPNSPERDRIELKLQLSLGVPLVALDGFASSELASAYHRAYQLCQQVDNPFEFFKALSGLKAYYDQHLELAIARDLGEQMLRLAQAQGGKEQQVVAHLVLGFTLLLQGELEAYRQHWQHSMQLYDPSQHQDLGLQFGFDPKIRALGSGAWGFWYLGFPEQAVHFGQEAVAYSETLSLPGMGGYARFCLAWCHYYRRESRQVLSKAEETFQYCNQNRVGFWGKGAEALSAWAQVYHGDPLEGLNGLKRALDQLLEMGGKMGYVQSLLLLVDACHKAGKLEQGLNACDEALRLTQESGYIAQEPELQRIKGELLLSLSPDNSEEAETWFRRAVQNASRQGARSWKLRALTSLCRLKIQKNHGEEALDQLGETYDSFSEGFELPDLIEARSRLLG